jgi:hypothetical protein
MILSRLVKEVRTMLLELISMQGHDFCGAINTMMIFDACCQHVRQKDDTHSDSISDWLKNSYDGR